MRPSLKVVTQLPLTELWTETGVLPASKEALLSEDDITTILRGGAFQFVVANIGDPLRWIPSMKCFEFWKSEAKRHIADPHSQVRLEDFPSGYAYFASRWAVPDASIILLERIH